ncbi:MAG: endonuclease NucS [Phycisphaerae bacterium]|nr:endonuclease NucS [Phycisphaerae bacterium]
MSVINFDAKELMLEKVKDFQIAEEEIQKRSKMRDEFISTFSKQKIKNLSPEEYFPGLGKKDGCIGYQLEWATRPLGSIKGGSMAKYGPKEQFQEIKDLLIELTNLSDDISVFYDDNGSLTQISNNLIKKSKNIKGMKSGRTVLGKLMSIYYPQTFLPVFTDQDYLLELILKDYSDDSIGLESFLRNNYMFLNIQKELSSEPAFLKEIPNGILTNDFLYKFLYVCFPRTKETEEVIAKKTQEEEKIEALETEHYQKLIHRNFTMLFKNLKYFDEESQNSHEGHYTTEDVGIMDFLCLDANNNIVVIELKRKGTDQTLAQLCRYMGWAHENLAQPNQKVLGLIVSESKDVRLEYAIKVVPNVTMKQMKLNVVIDDFVA